APGLTERGEVAEVRPPRCLAARGVTEMLVLALHVALPISEEAVAVPSPVTEPAPAVWAKVTTVELSLVTTLLLASSTAAVSVLVAAEATLAVREVATSVAGVPAVTEKADVSAGRPPPCSVA